MKTNAILIRLTGAFSACMFAMAPLAAAPAAKAEQLVVATQAACEKGKYKAGDARPVQASLNRIYDHDTGFKAEAGGRDFPLRDGIIGPVTLKWIGLFCKRHTFKASVSDFEASVVRELARVAADPGASPALEKEEATRMPSMETYFRYDPKDILKPQNMELLIVRLKTMSDRYYDKAQFHAAIRRALKGLKLDDATLARIETTAAIDGYLLPAAAVSDLSRQGASAELIDKLQSVTDITYDNADEFHGDLKIAVGEGKEKAELAKYYVQIIERAHVVDYRIPGTIEADLSAAVELEPPVAALYLSMANIPYPTKELFDSATGWRVDRALGMCPHNRYRQDGRLKDDEVKLLVELIQDKALAMDRIVALRNLGVACKPLEEIEAKNIWRIADKSLSAKLYNAAQLVRVGTAPLPPGQVGADSVKACDCAPDTSEGMIYGFYPLWTDSDKKQIDFGLLSRIGLYGLTFNDKGDLPPLNGKGAPLTLLQAAHRHMTKVDWVLHKNDWRAWSQGDAVSKGATFDRMLHSISRLLGATFPKTDWRGTAAASLGLERGPSMGDGITLRFEGFPVKDQNLFNKFVIQLYHQLAAMKPARHLKLIVTTEELEGEAATPFSAVNLQGLIAQTNPIDPGLSMAQSRSNRAADMSVLVLMKEPTVLSKLSLRVGIEKSLYSSERVRMLRNIVPVIEYDGVRAGQLRDDIIYFSDNFGGVGFWPLPFASEDDLVEGSTTANSVLRAHFKNTGVDGGAFDSVIDLVCPNRTWLRWLAWISLLLAIACGVVFARCRGCGTRLDQHPAYMAGMVALMVLPFIVVAALIMGDPLFNSESGMHWIFAALVIGLVIIPGAYLLLKPARKLP